MFDIYIKGKYFKKWAKYQPKVVLSHVSAFILLVTKLTTAQFRAATQEYIIQTTLPAVSTVPA